MKFNIFFQSLEFSTSYRQLKIIKNHLIKTTNNYLLYISIEDKKLNSNLLREFIISHIFIALLQESLFGVFVSQIFTKKANFCEAHKKIVGKNIEK